MREYTEDEMQRMRMTLNGETGLDKIKRKAREEPFVPAGVALTCFALLAATVGIRTGNKVYTNNMFRLRVAAQGFTVMAMVGGSIYYQQMKKF
ncbi:hypoxia induced protein conserved region-domain-containing protein [Helicostylum pulchrum]|nr:hypoxia induced protein conserved region-domain-containing protein [Helicostylum pulchrum]